MVVDIFPYNFVGTNDNTVSRFKMMSADEFIRSSLKIKIVSFDEHEAKIYSMIINTTKPLNKW